VAKRRKPRSVLAFQNGAFLLFGTSAVLGCGDLHHHRRCMTRARASTRWSSCCRSPGPGRSPYERRHATHPAQVKPELVATAPNTVCGWDITKLHGPASGPTTTYVILDIYSGYTVGSLLDARESAVLVGRLLAHTIVKQRSDRDTLTIHADTSSSMASKPVALLLADLGVTTLLRGLIVPAGETWAALLSGPAG
jgi:transposase InsO family protein